MGFLVFTRMSSGLSSVLGTGIIAEIYGVERIGQVRSLFSMFGIFSTALAPLVLGVLLDRGITFDQFALACVIFLCFTSLISFRIRYIN